MAAGLGLILLVAGGLFFALWSSRPQVKSAGGAPDATRGPKEEITNSIGMKLKLIRPGTFLMGSPKDEEGRFDDEGPQHEVEITRAFYLGVYPVTGAAVPRVRPGRRLPDRRGDGRQGRLGLERG